MAVASATRERTTTCSSAYTDKPTAADWNALVQKGVYTRVEVNRMRRSGNTHLGYRTAITRSGDWQFFVSGD